MRFREEQIPTKRQKELLELIYQYIKSSGYPPTFKEIREELGISSNQAVFELLGKLEKGGFIRRNESAARGITLLPLAYDALGGPHLAPFLGVTTAGMPAEAIETVGEWQPLPGGVARLKDEVFLLKVSGDSMINAGINDGDVVLVKQHQYFTSGEIVLAQVGGEATIKRFMSIDKPPYTYLKPENPKYDVILFKDDVELKGKVISVLQQNAWHPIS